MKYDLHIHTKYSACSNLEPLTILRAAKKRKIDGIAVTDHNSLKGAIAVSRLNKDKKYYRIRFLKHSIARFFSIIDTHIIPSMKYKMSYDPVETTRRSPNLI